MIYKLTTPPAQARAELQSLKLEIFTMICKTIYKLMFVCLFRYIQRVWPTCKNRREQDPKIYSNANGSHL